MKKRKVDWNDKTAIQEIVAKCFSLNETLRALGLAQTGTNCGTLKKYLKQLNIDYSHFDGNRYKRATARPLYEVMIKDSPYIDTTRLKKKLIKLGLLKNECRKCKASEVWMGEPLTLQLEHKNGDSSDNRHENLEILCPNCHSQTTTWGGKRRSIGQLRGNQIYSKKAA